ncbi:MAG: AtpZ/AtpI family protein [Acidimicrobiales bacterium]
MTRRVESERHQPPRGVGRPPRHQGPNANHGSLLEARVEGQQDSKLRSLITQQTALANRATTAKGDLYRNFGDGFTRAVELAITPVIFGALGYGLDGWLGTRPIFLTVFFLLAIVGMLLRTWYGYAYRMEALEQASPWNNRPAAGEVAEVAEAAEARQP